MDGAICMSLYRVHWFVKLTNHRGHTDRTFPHDQAQRMADDWNRRTTIGTKHWIEVAGPSAGTTAESGESRTPGSALHQEAHG